MLIVRRDALFAAAAVFVLITDENDNLPMFETRATRLICRRTVLGGCARVGERE